MVLKGWFVYFYPRPPRGGRQNFRAFGPVNGKFLSTPSARRATCSGRVAHVRLLISIHALREEGDARSALLAHVVRDFYPRPPRGGRPRYPGVMRKFHYFYPRPPRGGRHVSWCKPLQRFNFYPRPPRGGRPTWLSTILAQQYFYPRPPRGGRQQGERV